MTIEPLIKSRPSYGPVTVQINAKLHLFICTAEGQSALQTLIDAIPQTQRQLLVFSATDARGAVDEKGHSLLAEQVGAALCDAPLATAIYLSGPEAFMWDLRNLARSVGFADEQIQMCEPVGNARRLFCTHCYAITEEVSHSPQTCSGCGRLLLVRDHYSKLHAAYVGVQINAEDPAEIPEPEALS
ncbi:hypothetical protein GCM10011352_09010 [Marinobacterium zhoushanense]|uniref:Dimethylamine monooxygenase subunit DmmA-like C-terminal domain-containing protein n=1 Tax=Marinobacterium zhoushanense TaxID=1679163 RepID=A0ABQ1K1R7_9GAMM|nr:dimethylamine monooxygenase subunit DmmA family protein [Marinobacterium zhoushanense]GGB85379.1 hypothetical protein GCM10011352_09010 [Marinobacterium zhoushanense]